MFKFAPDGEYFPLQRLNILIMSDLDFFKEQLNSKLENYKSLFNSSDGWDLGFKACCEMIQKHLETH